MNEVMVIGSSNVDVIAQVQRFPAPGETIFGTDVLRAGGGKGMNQAVAAVRLGLSPVSFVTALGSDPDGDWLAELADADNITSVATRTQSPTGTALITVDAAGENTIVVIPGANMYVTAEQAEAAVRERRPSVVSLCLEIPMQTVTAAARAGREVGATVVLNPSPFQPLPDELVEAVDVMVLNELEVEQLAGHAWERQQEAAQGWFASHGLTAVVTLGSRGAAVLQADDLRHVHAPKVAAVDTTGCGDAFTGAFGTQLAQGSSPTEAATFACRVAAHAAMAHGTQPSYGTLAEVEALDA